MNHDLNNPSSLENTISEQQFSSLPVSDNPNSSNTNKRFKINFEFIKENKELIVLIPSIAGALWQFLELASIHLSYIRFFSVTQMAIDGFLVVAFITVILFYFFITSFVFKFTLKSKIKAAQEYVSNLSGNNFLVKIKEVAIIMFLIFCLLASIFFSVTELFAKSPFFALFMIWFSILISSSEITKRFLRLNYLMNLKNKFATLILTSERKTLENIISFMLLIFPILLFFSIKLSIPSLRNAFSSAPNLKNLGYVKEAVFKDYKTDNFLLRYLNDKYVFVQLCKTPKCISETEDIMVIYKSEDVLFKDDKP